MRISHDEGSWIRNRGNNIRGSRRRRDENCASIAVCTAGSHRVVRVGIGLAYLVRIVSQSCARRIRNRDRNLSRFIVHRISNRQLPILSARPLGWRSVGWKFHRRWRSDHLPLEVIDVLDAKPVSGNGRTRPISAALTRRLT